MASGCSALFLPIILLCFALPSTSANQNSPNITLGSSLFPEQNSTSLWVRSQSGDFAFGFLPLEPDRFLLAIWFAKEPSNSVVWWPASTNGDAAVVQEGSRAELSTSGRLSLLNSAGQEVWFAESESVVTNGALLDTGNLVLIEGDSNKYAWQSFDNPTDTILPTQVIRKGGKLFSRRSSRLNEYSSGRFELRLLPDGNLVLNTIGFPTPLSYERYWISNNTFQTDDIVVFDPNYGVRVSMNKTNLYNVTITNFGSVTDFYQRATLDSDGVFRHYKQYKPDQYTNGSTKKSWSVMDFVPKNICMDLMMQNGGSGACGFNSYCIFNGDKPKCLCPDHYSPLDPDDIINQGCWPDFELPSCEQYNSTDFDLVEMHSADWPNADYEVLSPLDEIGCRRACLEDCRCLVAVANGGNCWKKKMPMSNGRIDSNNGRLAIFKIRKVDSLNSTRSYPTEKERDNKTKTVISLSAILGGSALINFIVITSLVLLFFSKRRIVAEMKKDSTAVKTNLQAFSYVDLEKATDNFKEELGKGSFGSVYKGVLISRGIPVAVKKLNVMAQQGEKEFIAEMSVIGRTHHKNLVQLIGFCDEGSHRILVYEFMSNGSLASFLFQTEKPRWEKRVQIAYGIARGLSYLHDQCSNQIIHCDIKPQNILLDENFTARISDFGLAKLLMTDQTRTKTSIRGTKGYVAPEWFKDKLITAKVDVYSFGVVLLETICCRKNVEKDFGEDERTILTDWAYECYTDKRLGVLVQYDEDAITDHRRLERFVAVAIWCIQEEPSLRPSMKKVTLMLEGAVEVPSPPDPSSFISSIN